MGDTKWNSSVLEGRVKYLLGVNQLREARCGVVRDRFFTSCLERFNSYFWFCFFINAYSRDSIDSFNDEDRIGQDRPASQTSPYVKAGKKSIHWTVGVVEFQWDCLQCKSYE